MQQYLIMVIGSALLAAISHAMTPEKWQKYINAITGIMIVSVIAAPVFELRGIDIFSEYSYSAELDENGQKIAVCNELEKRVSRDAQERLKSMLGSEYKVETELSVNKDYEIEGVKVMTVWAKEKREQIKTILEEVYSPEKILFR